MTALPAHAIASVNPDAQPVDRILAEVHSWPLFAGPVIHARALTATDDVETFELWVEQDRAVRTITVERSTSDELTTLRFRGADTAATVVRYRGDVTGAQLGIHPRTECARGRGTARVSR